MSNGWLSRSSVECQCDIIDWRQAYGSGPWAILPAKIMLEYLASLSRERLLALVRELQQQMTLLQRQVTEVAATNDALRAEIDQLKRGSKRQATPSTWTHGSQRFLPCQEHAVGPPEGRSDIARPALGEGQLHRCQPNGQQALEDALLCFMRFELPGMFPGTFDQRLESGLSFRDTFLDLERFHGDPPNVVNHRDTAQMFPGFYHGRWFPCTRTLCPRATLSPNAFHAHSM